MIGKNITAVNDKLNKIDVLNLYEFIAKPSNEFKSQINTLRTILSFDEKKYKALKTKLPYFCTSIFNPPFRKSQNFAATNYFVLDIDHIAEADINIMELKIRMTKNNQITLLFNSPSNNGLKIVFALKEKCFDKTKFSMFYQIFAKKFAQQYNIEQIIDKRTHDVTRACFLSFDNNAYYNHNAEKIDISNYINFDSIDEVEEAKLFIDEQIKKNKDDNIKHQKIEIDKDVWFEIKQKLNPKIKKQKDKIIYVPEKLNEVITEIKDKSKAIGLNVSDVTNINYGKKIKFEAQKYWAEINIFYGKKGFSVVKTPKKGSSFELANIAHSLLCEILYPQK